MRFKKVAAVLMAATMVFGMAAPAGAEENVSSEEFEYKEAELTLSVDGDETLLLF